MRGRPEAIDTNGDHAITLDELTGHIAAYGKNRRVRPANPSIGWDAEAISGTETSRRQATASDGLSAKGPDDAKKTVVSGAEPGPTPGKQPRRDAKFYVPKSRLPAGLPDWFLRGDANGDGQVSLSEFAPNPTPSDLAQFARHDKNGDGFITVQEYLGALRPAKAASGKAGEKGGAKASRKRSGAPGN